MTYIQDIVILSAMVDRFEENTMVAALSKAANVRKLKYHNRQITLAIKDTIWHLIKLITYVPKSKNT